MAINWRLLREFLQQHGESEHTEPPELDELLQMARRNRPPIESPVDREISLRLISQRLGNNAARQLLQHLSNGASPKTPGSENGTDAKKKQHNVDQALPMAEPKKSPTAPKTGEEHKDKDRRGTTPPVPDGTTPKTSAGESQALQLFRLALPAPPLSLWWMLNTVFVEQSYESRQQLLEQLMAALQTLSRSQQQQFRQQLYSLDPLLAASALVKALHRLLQPPLSEPTRPSADED